ncbi:zinc dependent phospholipase C family protein [Paenibacillus sp. MBLB4367]|uniref:zinc dependent phospholipase C family protein n=1 Tax=Paenibacillus sp. MBLB4367 TaxID=3384767 RepID=UPI0039082671
MIHFAIAYRLFDSRPHPAFLLGAIAPDAVTLRKQDTAAKKRSHLTTVEGKAPSKEALKEHCRNAVRGHTEPGFKPFIAGYMSHIIADIGWGNVKREVSCSNAALKELLWQEEIKMDFLLFRSVEWRNRLIEDVCSSPLYEWNDLYSIDELNAFRKHVFDWLSDTAKEPDISPRYITGSVVERFIESAVEELTLFYEDIGLDLATYTSKPFERRD